MSNYKNINTIKSLTVLGLLLYSQQMQASWATPEMISDQTSDQVTLVVDASGNATAAWQGFDGTNYNIQVASKAYNGSWSSPAVISDAQYDFAQSPVLAVDDSGNLLALWNIYTGQVAAIQFSGFPTGGSWSSAATISDTSFNSDLPNMVANRYGTLGNAAAIWHHYNGTNFIARASELPFEGSWSTATSIFASGEDAMTPAIGMDASGNLVAVSILYDGTGYSTVAASKIVNDTWGPSYTLSDNDESVNATSLAVSSGGDAAVTWCDYNGTHYQINVATLPYGQSWSSATVISNTSNDAYMPSVKMDAAGNMVAVWIAFDGSEYVLHTASCPSAGSWSSITTLSTSGSNVGNINLLITESGDAHVIWDEDDGSNSAIFYATLPYQGSWSAAASVSNTTEYAYLPSVALDGSGNAVATWLQFDGSDVFVWASTQSSQ